MSLPIIYYYDLHPPASHLEEEIIASLSQPQKQINPKFFYDCHGSELFDAICELPEYYISRTENNLLQSHSSDIANLIDSSALLIELGSGSCQKVRNFLGTLNNTAYMPIDISKNHLWRAVKTLSHDFPTIPIHAVCLDYSHNIEIPYEAPEQKKIFFFPGSSISNFEPESVLNFLTRLATLAKPNGGLLIGVDLQKPAELLHAAYNDSKGVTAAFNKNILQRLNRELNANFELNQFSHHAFYNEKQHRIEMHLVSEKNQDVKIGTHLFHFKKQESIHTENSYKYTIEQFQQIAQQAGFNPQKFWTDKNQLFSIHYFSF